MNAQKWLVLFWKALRLDVESDRAHELQRITGLNDSGAQTMVKAEFVLLEMILKMKIRSLRSDVYSNFGERQVMSCKQSNSSSFQEIPHHSFCADTTVVRICSLQQFVEQEQNRHRSGGQISDYFQACDFGIKARDSALQGIQYANGGAYGQSRKLEPVRANRCAALCQNSVDSNRADEGTFPGHVGSANNDEPKIPSESQIVANCAVLGNKGMRESYSVEERCLISERGENIIRVFVCIAGEIQESFDLTQSGEPSANSGSKFAAPRIDGERPL